MCVAVCNCGIIDQKWQIISCGLQSDEQLLTLVHILYVLCIINFFLLRFNRCYYLKKLKH